MFYQHNRQKMPIMKFWNGGDSLAQQLIKTGNRDVTGQDFRWIETQKISSMKVILLI
jgi:ABC-type phosphate transport system auxiliary subunit